MIEDRPDSRQSAIGLLEMEVSDATKGLPEDIFLFVSRLTPMVNVDLLVKDENGRVLLSWRDDIYAGKGWHVPGGIVRFKETFETRLQKVAEQEIGTMVEYDPVPVAINQVILRHDVRGHFISLLYRCYLSGEYVPRNNGLSERDRGFLAWHDVCPSNLIEVHDMYRKYI